MPRPRRVTERARSLRLSTTDDEARLWAWLRTLRAEGFHFRRQAPLRGYYVDFVCLRRRLVIEADGGQHTSEDQARHDRVRDAALARAGFTILRFDNFAIRFEPDGVARDILRALGARAETGALTPAPSVRPSACHLPHVGAARLGGREA